MWQNFLSEKCSPLMMVEEERVIEKQIGPIVLLVPHFFMPTISSVLRSQYVAQFLSEKCSPLMMVEEERVIEKQIGPIDPD